MDDAIGDRDAVIDPTDSRRQDHYLVPHFVLTSRQVGDDHFHAAHSR